MEYTTKIERDLSLSHDAVGEFTVPDYLPAVGKLLSASATTAPDEIYLSEKNGSLAADCGGTVTFRVLWLGEDGTPASMAFSCSYDTTSPLGCEKGADCIAETLAESVFCRVTGPRKLSLRCRLVTHITAFSREKCPSQTADGLEALTTEISASLLRFASSRGIFTTATVPVGTVDCRGAVKLDGFRADTDTLTVDGELLLSALISGDNGAFRAESVSVPFSEKIAFDGADALNCACRGYIESIELREIGDALTAEITYALTASGVVEGTASVVSDAYICGHESSVTQCDILYISQAAVHAGALTVSEELDGELSPSAAVISRSASVGDVVSDDKKLVISGILRFEVFDLGEVKAFSVPWRFESPDGRKKAELYQTANVDILNCELKCDGKRSFISAEIAVTALSASSESISAVSDVTLGEEVTAGEITVYYPRKDEGLWEIAKRFRVPRARAERGNFTDGKVNKVVVI